MHPARANLQELFTADEDMVFATKIDDQLAAPDSNWQVAHSVTFFCAEVVTNKSIKSSGWSVERKSLQCKCRREISYHFEYSKILATRLIEKAQILRSEW